MKNYQIQAIKQERLKPAALKEETENARYCVKARQTFVSKPNKVF